MWRILTVLVVVAVLVLAVAWYREWFTVAVTHPGDDRTDIEVGVHRDKFHEDVDQLRKRVQKSAPTEIKGTLTTVNTSEKRVALQHDKETLTLEVGDGTQIHIGGRGATVADLRPAMKVTVAYTAHDGRNLAQSIRVDREAP